MSLLKTRKQFVKDTKIPIPVFDEPYFDYFLELYDKLFNAKEEYNSMINKVNSLGGFDNYRHTYHEFKDMVIDNVKNKEEYKNVFLQFDLNKFNFNRNYNSSNRKFFNVDNTEKKWISVDFNRANFHSLKYIDDRLVDGFKTYEDWILSFENGELFYDIKSIRQVIFGNLNPKRQQKIQSFILNSIIETINNEFNDVEFYVMGSDEFIIEFDESIYEFIMENKRVIDEEHGFPIKIEVFELKNNSEITEFGYVKEIKNVNGEKISDKVVLKEVPKYFYAQAYKKYLGEEIHEYDLLFYNENILSTFLTPLENKIGGKI